MVKVFQTECEVDSGIILLAFCDEKMGFVAMKYIVGWAAE
jgi:hypothetical protein